LTSGGLITAEVIELTDYSYGITSEESGLQPFVQFNDVSSFSGGTAATIVSGTSSPLDPISSISDNLASQVSVARNPSSDFFLLNIGTLSNTSYQIINGAGSVVESNDILSGQTQVGSDIQAGVYVIKVLDASGALIKVEKLIKF